MNDQLLEQADCLASLEEIDSAVSKIAALLNERFEGKEVLALCVLNGGVVFTGQLLPRLTMRLKLDYVHASRYRGEMSGSKNVSFLAEPSTSLEGKHVLVLDDIFDEGQTLEAIVAYIEKQGVASVSSAVLCHKVHKRKPESFKPDFSALELPDRYVFGVGMDRYGFYRNAPGIFAMHGE